MVNFTNVFYTKLHYIDFCTILRLPENNIRFLL